MTIYWDRLAPAGQWDQSMAVRLLKGGLYPHGLDIAQRTPGIKRPKGCILLVPGRYWFDDVEAVQRSVNRYEWVLAMRTSDEEDLFDISKVEHPNIKWWVQTPRTDRDYGDSRFMPLGFPAHFNDLRTAPPKKVGDVFLMAQNTHERRKQAFEALKDFPNSAIMETEGFTQGTTPEKYMMGMTLAKVAPCPSGAVCPETFRFWEALESHTIPIADDISPAYDSRGYWEKLFSTPEHELPFMIYSQPDNVTNLSDDVHLELGFYPWNLNEITAWYMRYKRQLSRWLREDLKELGAIG